MELAVSGAGRLIAIVGSGGAPNSTSGRLSRVLVGRGAVVCFGCCKSSHIWRDCQGGSACGCWHVALRCLRCGEVGHWASRCHGYSLPVAGQDGRPVATSGWVKHTVETDNRGELGKIARAGRGSGPNYLWGRQALSAPQGAQGV